MLHNCACVCFINNMIFWWSTKGTTIRHCQVINSLEHLWTLQHLFLPTKLSSSYVTPYSASGRRRTREASLVSRLKYVLSSVYDDDNSGVFYASWFLWLSRSGAGNFSCLRCQNKRNTCFVSPSRTSTPHRERFYERKSLFDGGTNRERWTASRTNSFNYWRPLKAKSIRLNQAMKLFRFVETKVKKSSTQLTHRI